MKRVCLIICALAIALNATVVFAAGEKIQSTADFSYKSFDAVSGAVKITFDITVNTVSDGVMGIASADIVPKNYSDYAICFRIREGGFFDANNGSDFDKVNEIEYAANKKYGVEIVADTMTQLYSAFVYVDGEKTLVAENYKFRTYAENLGKFTARGGGGVAAGLYCAENINATQAVGEYESFVLPNFFCENMVLQRNKPHIIYGKASGEVTVKISDGENTSQMTVCAKDGRFEAELEPLPPKLTPYTMTVSTKDKTMTVENVFVGDVFMLAGQSNMAQNYEHQTTEQLGDGVTQSNMPEMITDERIKFFKLSRTASNTESFDVPFETDGWCVLDGSSAKKLSYIGMYFAKERLEKEPDVPVGLMSTAWRGTSINRWMRKSAENARINYTPTNGDIYNNHIAPFVDYPISAVLWYQGESDAKNPIMYEEAFEALIKDWRMQWNDDDLPFLFVQLARYSKDDYAPLREAQRKALTLENTAMVVSLDTDKGTYNNIHPLGKEEIGRRLSLCADKLVYGEKVVCSGPVFEKAEKLDGAIKVYFDEKTIGDGLCIENTYAQADKLCEFEIAPKNGEFVKAEAVINPDNTVTVFADGVEYPEYVRYAYSKVPENPNLFNANGLPASPFTTEERKWSLNSFASYGFEAGNGTVQTVTLELTPMRDKLNGVIGLTESGNEVSAWNSCGITVRFNKNGYFEYIDAGEFKTSTLKYERGKTYKIEIVADFTDKTYAVIADGELLCEKAGFRTGSLNMESIGRILLRGGDGESAEEFFANDIGVFDNEANSVIRVKKNGESAMIAVLPTGKAYAAKYDGKCLTNVKTTSCKGFEVICGDFDRVFFWDDAISPVKLGLRLDAAK